MIVLTEKGRTRSKLGREINKLSSVYCLYVGVVFYDLIGSN